MPTQKRSDVGNEKKPMSAHGCKLIDIQYRR